MALDLSAITKLPYQDTITLSATAGKVTMLTIPRHVALHIYARATDAKVVLGDDVAQTDDVDLGAADYATAPASQWIEVFDGSEIGGRTPRTVYYLASSTASQVIEVWLRPGSR